MPALRLRPSCARCARRTDYCDTRFDRSEFPTAWPFIFEEDRLPHLEALPVSQVMVSACAAGRDVYAPHPEGPCEDFVSAAREPEAVYWPWHMPRALADHQW